MMNQVIVTVGYVEHHLLMKELVVVLLGLNKLLLPSNLQNFTVRIGVLGKHERRAGRGPVFGHKPPRLVPNPARIAEGFRAHGSRSPLRRLVRCAVETLPPFAVATHAGRHGGGGGVLLLRSRRFLPGAGRRHVRLRRRRDGGGGGGGGVVDGG